MAFSLKKRSIRLHTLSYFLLLSLLLISALWLFNELYLSPRVFPKIKQREIIKSVDELLNRYNPVQDSANDFYKDLHDLTIKNNLLIYYFSFDERGMAVNAPADKDGNVRLDGAGRPLKKLNVPLQTKVVFSAVVKEGNYSVSEMPWDEYAESRFIYLAGLIGQNKNGQEFEENRLYYASEGLNNNSQARYFLYMEAVISAEEITVNLVRFEFVIITFFCLLLTLVFSLLLSSATALPITKISKSAESLAKGDYSVKFKSSNVSEIDTLAQTLNFAANEFSKTEQARREFIANISHDLRTPLTMVRAYAEMIRDFSTKKPEKTKENAAIIIEEADRLARLVEDIQKFSRIESGREKIALEPINLDELCQNVIRQFKGAVEKWGYNLTYSGEESTIVLADKEKISQVLYNMISNAINYTDKSDKKIAVRFKSDEKNMVRIEVSDNGKGIPKDEINMVWEKYYRLNQEKRNVVGSGLGLPIIKSILLAHQVDFGIESEVGIGTTFWFNLEKTEGNLIN